MYVIVLEKHFPTEKVVPMRTSSTLVELFNCLLLHNAIEYILWANSDLQAIHLIFGIE